MKITLAKRIAACLVVSCTAAQSAFAAPTDISNVPLGASAGGGFLPNLLFILDDSGSMGNDYNPDYVNDNNTCLATNGGSTACQRGDPPFEAGGQNGFNGVGYDPNFTYLPGLTSAGVPQLNPGTTPPGSLTVTKVLPDAYLSAAGSEVDVTQQIPDKRFCNSNNLCKRNAADNAGAVLPAGGKDAQNRALAQGQTPYRAHASNSSTLIFGLPEMMQQGIFVRNNTTSGGFVGTPTSTVRVTTVEPHGLATGDTIFTSATNMAVNCVAVTRLDNNNFTYASTGTTSQARNGSWRKCAAGSFSRSSGSVTVTSAGHGLVKDDVITTFVSGQTTISVSNVTVAVLDANTFTYSAGSGSIAATAGFWARTGLYNSNSTVNGTAIAYSITPIEWCSDVNLTTCKEIYPLVIPPAKPTGADAVFSIPAYVRFCKTQADALAPSTVTGTSVPIPQTTPTATPASARCQLKFVNQNPLTAYTFPRYGWFNRDTIVNPPPGLKFTNRSNRSDCTTAGTAPDCTYTEEIQNYAKWYTYYRTRMQMMKTAAGRAFLPFISNPTGTPVRPDRLRVGFITINPTFRNSDNVQGNPAVVEASKYLRIDNFNNVKATPQANTWYNKFYAIKPNNSTPLRTALSRAGWIYAGKLGTNLTAGIPGTDDPIQASCQKNYAFLTTDGFWNQGRGIDLGGNDMGNQDNLNNDSNFPIPNPYVPPDSNPAKVFVSRPSATFDGATSNVTADTGVPGGAGTLADVAMYYYRTDLRGGTDLAKPTANTTGPATSPNGPAPTQDVSANNVPPSGTFDFATHQHMTTFTIGLADGLMRYQADYATNPFSDYSHIANGDSGACFWNPGTTCNWPLPAGDGQSALDDLWHAAVNGRGSFYSAINPILLANGLSSALNALDLNVASASAAATSSPQVATGKALAFSTTYQTSTWSGQIYAQKILANGEVDESTKLWEGDKLLIPRIPTPAAPLPLDPRKIVTFDVSNPNNLKDFTFTSLSSSLPSLGSGSEQGVFASHCAAGPTAFSHCASLTALQVKTANDPSKLIDFLRGIADNEGGAFRDRSEQDQTTGLFVQTVLGDIIDSQPVTVAAPFNQYENEQDHKNYTRTKAGLYKAFSDPAQFPGNRAPFVIVGANDGFLHSFDQVSGRENWAYLPRFLMPNLYQLADKNYPGQHRYFVDGSPEVADVFDTIEGKWKTIVVGGMNAGGRGFYALDITNPIAPRGLWEFCSDSTWCPKNAVGPHSDKDLGFSYGNPVIGRMDRTGRWVVVVTSGLNNVGTNGDGTTGDGRGYFFILDAITGQILHKVLADDGTGSTTSPSGLMKIGAYYGIGLDDPNFSHVYGGDQKGHVWRMDLSVFPEDNTPKGQTAPTFVDYTDASSITSDNKLVALLANLADKSGRIQPITARPAGTHLGPDPFAPKTRIYYVGTGRYLGNSDLSDLGPGQIAWQQTLYGIRDQLDQGEAWVGAGGFKAAASFRTGTKAGATVEQVLGQAALDRTITKNSVDWTTQDGFFIDLNPKFANDPPEGNSPGEREFLDVRLFFGTLVYTTNAPAQGGSCAAGGTSFQYALDFRTGGYVGNDATAHAGAFINQFLVGTAIVQTGPGEYKLLNKTIKGKPLSSDLPVDLSFQGKRFSYRER